MTRGARQGKSDGIRRGHIFRRLLFAVEVQKRTLPCYVCASAVDQDSCLRGPDLSLYE